MDPFELGDARLRLRVPNDDDVDATYEACQDRELQRWTTVPSPYTRRHAQDWIRRIVPHGWVTATDLTWVVEERSTSRLVGAIGVRSRPDQAWAVADVGYWVAAPARGRGVASDAVRLVARHAFDALGVQRLEWRATVANVASRRVAEKVGFTIEGTLRRGLDQRGTRVDAWIGSLLPGELR